MYKNYIIDANIFIEDADCIEILRNGQENNVFVPETVINELDKLKKDIKLKPYISKASENLLQEKENITIIKTENKDFLSNDDRILDEIKSNNIENPILVTNDKLLQFKAIKEGINSEEFLRAKPYSTLDEIYTGFIDIVNDDPIPNCFYWREDNQLCHFSGGKTKTINYEHKIWNITPRNSYQNAAFELMLNDNLDIVTLLSKAGTGKTLLSLATALYLVLQEKCHEKIYVVKKNTEIGEKIGYLPGEQEDKVEPFFRPIKDLIFALHEKRNAKKLFMDEEGIQLNRKRIEFLPINFIRGLNITQSIVIIDELQNLSRQETRSILSRMGEGTRCFCTGDVTQVDNPYLNQHNNGLNWVIKLFTGQTNYGHITLKGKRSRGPIADLVNTTGL